MSIKTVQSNLVQLGYGSYLRPFGIDGKDGTKTRKAVKTFQSDYNIKFKKKIKVDGVAGIETENAFAYYKKRVGKKGTKNFNITEFYSKDGGGLLKKGMSNSLLLNLEKLRYNLGDKSIIVTSGYRTKKHNRNVGGVKNSQHLYGRASDIKVKGVLPSKVYNESIKLFDGVGKYNTFTHVDMRGYKARF